MHASIVSSGLVGVWFFLGKDRNESTSITGSEALRALKTIKPNQTLQVLPMRDMLPSSLTRLCNRLAAEQTKAYTWRLGMELRQEYQKRLGAGESIAELEADIQARALQAAHEQLRLSVQPSRDRMAARAGRQ